jgi:four helix bundle protein
MPQQEKIKRFEQLRVWQEAHALALKVYETTRAFPADERFGLTMQMRKAAASTASNIAEGFKRRSVRDKVHFYNISQGSNEEVRCDAILARDLAYRISFEDINRRCDCVARMLSASITTMEERARVGVLA